MTLSDVLTCKNYFKNAFLYSIMNKQKTDYNERYKEHKSNYMKIRYQERREEFLQKIKNTEKKKYRLYK